MSTEPERLWGVQYPFERNHLQRAMALTGLGGVFAVTVILLARQYQSHLRHLADLRGRHVRARSAVPAALRCGNPHRVRHPSRPAGIIRPRLRSRVRAYRRTRLRAHPA